MSETPGKDSRGFYMLPQMPEEAGYYTYGTPGGGRGQYAHSNMLTFIFQVGFLWSSSDDRKIGVGNISLADGAKYDPHKSHKSGLEVDLRPIRKDKLRLPVKWQSIKDYDRGATQKLIDIMWKTGLVKKVFFNDTAIVNANYMAGHDDHIHVEVIG